MYLALEAVQGPTLEITRLPFKTLFKGSLVRNQKHIKTKLIPRPSIFSQEEQERLGMLHSAGSLGAQGRIKAHRAESGGTQGRIRYVDA